MKKFTLSERIGFQYNDAEHLRFELDRTFKHWLNSEMPDKLFAIEMEKIITKAFNHTSDLKELEKEIKKSEK